MKTGPASRQSTMRGTGMTAIKSGHKPEPSSKIEAEKQFQEEGISEFEAKQEEARALDKLGEIMEHSPFVEFQTPTQIWGVKAVSEKAYSFSRWYFMAKINAIVDTFMTQESYDSADVEARRAVAHKYGTRYAALGPNHSRLPHKDLSLRKKFPSLTEQLSQKVG